MQVKKQQLELDIEQQTGSKPGKEYIKAVYCHPAYLTGFKAMLKIFQSRFQWNVNQELPDVQDGF